MCTVSAPEIITLGLALMACSTLVSLITIVQYENIYKRPLYCLLLKLSAFK